MTRLPAAAGAVRGPGIRTWWLGARPRTLGISVLPVALGVAVSGRLRPLPALAALVVAISLQVGANYANDYFDGVRGIDGPARLGPPRLVANRLAQPRQVLGAAVFALGLAAVVGSWLALASGLGLLLGVGALAVAAALLYTGGPRPYAAAGGLADLAVFVFFGLVATCGTAAAQGRVVAGAWLAATSLGLMAVAILAANNLRDIATDAAAGRRTIMVRLGDSRARIYYCLLVAGALLVPVAGVAARALPWPALAVLLAVPVALPAIRLGRRGVGLELRPLLQATARLHLAIGLALTVALAISPPS